MSELHLINKVPVAMKQRGRRASHGGLVAAKYSKDSNTILEIYSYQLWIALHRKQEVVPTTSGVELTWKEVLKWAWWKARKKRRRNERESEIERRDSGDLLKRRGRGKSAVPTGETKIKKEEG